MDEEYGKLIDDLTAAGASDEEITAILEERMAGAQPVQPAPTANEVGGHAVGTFNKVVTDVVPQTLQAAGIATTKAANLLAQGTNALGLTDAAPLSVEDNPLYQAGQKVEQWKADNLDHIPDSRLSDNFFATDIPAGLGSVAAVMASQGRSLFKDVALKSAARAGTINAVKETGKALASRPVATGGVMMAVPEYDAAIEAGLSEDQAFDVFLKNYLIGGTETLPIERALSFINKVTGNRIMRTIKSGAVGSIEEAIQEALQTYLANQVAAGSYDPERDPLDGVLRAMAAGGLIGGGLAGAGGALSERRKKPTEAQALYEAEAQALADPITSTGDKAVDTAIDSEFADISAKLDALEIEEKADPYTDEEALNNLVGEFNAIEEENELSKQEFTPEEAGAIQAEGPLPSAIEQETMLDDAEATPALDQRIEEFTPTLQDENEIPPGTEFTPEEAAALQAAQLPTQATQEINLDDSESTPAIPTATEQLESSPVNKQRLQESVEEHKVGKVEAKELIEPARPIRPKADPIEQARIRQEDKAKAKEEKLRENVTKQLSKIQTSYKPGKRLQRLQELDERTLDYPEINKEVVKVLDQERAIQEDKVYDRMMKTATPTEKLDILGGRASSDEDVKAVEDIKKSIEILDNPTDLDAVDEAKIDFEDAVDRLTNSTNLLSSEQSMANRIAKELRAQFDKALEPRVQAEKEAKAKNKDRAKQIKDKKDDYLTKVATSIAKNTPAMVDLDIKSYQKWRKEQGLKEISDADIKKQAQAEFYTERAKSGIKRAALDERKRARATEEEIEREARRKAQEDIRNEFGLSEDTDISEIGNGRISGELEPGVAAHIALFSDVKPITVDALFKRIEASYQGNKQFLTSLRELFNISTKFAKKHSTTGLELYMADANPDAPQGFYAVDDSNQRQLLLISRSSEGTVDAHEFIHFITSAITHNIAKARGKGAVLDRFYNKLGNIYSDARGVYRNKILGISRALENGDELSQRDHQFLALLQGYLETSGTLEYTRGPLTSEQLRDIYDNTFRQVGSYRKGRVSYLFYDTDELLAETFSNPYAMGIMSMLPSHTKNEAGKQVSFFRELIDSLKQMLDSIAKQVGVKFTPAKNNYLEELTQFMEKMESTYLTEFNEDAPTPPFIENLRRGVTNLFKQFHAMAPLAGKKLPKDFMPIVNMTANRVWKNEKVKSLADVQKIVDKINAGAKKNKLPIQTAPIIWAKIEKYRQQWVEAKTVQINTRDYGRTLPEYKESVTFRKDLEDFASINLDELSSIKKITEVERGMLELISHGIPSQEAYNIANKAKAQQLLKVLNKHIGKYVKGGKYFGMFDPKLLANPATFASILSKYDKEAANDLFKVVYGGILEAKTLSQKETLEFTKKLYAIANKHNMSQNDYIKTHMYGVAFTTVWPENHPKYWEEIEHNLNTIIENSINKIRAIDAGLYDGISSKTAKLELKIAQDLKESVLKRRSMSGILTGPQTQLYDTFRDFLKKHESDVKRNAVGVWGDNTFYSHKNYMPTVALGRDRTGNLDPNDNVMPNTKGNSLWEALQTGRNYGNIRSKQAGNTKTRTQPKGYFYDYNLFSVAHKVAPTLLLDLYATRELKALNQLLNGDQGSPITLDGKSIRNVLPAKAIASLNYQMQNIVSYSPKVDADVSKAFKIAARGVANLKTAFIATGGQFIVQASSAVPAALIMSPKGFGRAMKVMAGFEQGVGNFSIVKDFINKNGLSIQLRDALFERFQTVEDVQKSGFERGFSRVTGGFERAATHLLRSGDKAAARLVWFSAYFDAGGTIENPTVDAVLAAERAVGVMQNMSDISFSAPIFKGDTPQKRMLITMFFAFKSFAFNSAINTYYSASNLIGDATKGKFNKEAAKVLSSNITMAMAYHIGALYLIKPMYKAISESLFGDDDDEEERNVTNTQYIAENVAWDMIFGQATPGVIDAALRYMYGQGNKMLAKSRGETYNAFSDSALFIPRDWSSSLGEGIGPYGDILESVVGSGLIFGKMAAESMGLLEEDTEENWEIAAWTMLRDMALLTQILPFRGDLQKLLRMKIRKLKGENTAGRTTPSNIGPYDDSGTEFEVESNFEDTEYETPEYE